MKRAAILLCLIGSPLSAHRLDEYLQGVIISIEKDRVQVQLSLTPGTAIFPVLLAEIDSDRDSKINEAEQQSYAKRVINDLSLTIDGYRLTPKIRSQKFPTMDEMREGRGEIQLDLIADVPSGPRQRNLTFENHHQPQISAYQVNTLVPSDHSLRIEKQDRNYTQSHYRLEYEQSADLPFTAKLAVCFLSAAAILRLAWVYFTSQRRELAEARTDHLAPS